MKKILLALMLLQSLFACRNNNADLNNALMIANEGLINSTTSSRLATANILLAFQEKKSDPSTADKAKFYEPQMLAIDRYAKDLQERIERIKNDVWKDRNNDHVSAKILQQTAALPGLMSALRDSVLLNNPYIHNKQQPASLVLFAEEFDQRILNGESINQLLFQSASPLEAGTLLSRFQLNIQELARKNVLTILENTSRRSLICTFIMPLIGQSHQVLQPNGQLTLEVAMGEIWYNGLQKVLVNGKEIPQDETGVCKAKFTAPAVAGKYSMPVVASYIDQDGKEWTIKKDIKYEVIKCETGDTERAKE